MTVPIPRRDISMHAEADDDRQEEEASDGGVERIFEMPLKFDPLLARMDSLDQLPIEDRLGWIRAWKTALLEKREQGATSTGAYAELVTQALREVIDIQLNYLDALYEAVVEEHDKLAGSGPSGG